MTTTTTHQSPITTIRLIGLFAVLAWGLFVIVGRLSATSPWPRTSAVLAWAMLVVVGPLMVAMCVHIPAGHIGMAAGCVVLAAIMSAPWFVFGLPVVRRFVQSII